LMEGPSPPTAKMPMGGPAMARMRGLAMMAPPPPMGKGGLALTTFKVHDKPPAHGDLTPVARLGGLLALAVSPAHHAAFATTRDGGLRVYSYPALELRATYRLTQPAYQALVDDGQARLYLAGSAPEALQFGPLGDRLRARGSLLVYDLLPLLKGPPREAPLTPLHTLGLDVDVQNMALSPGGEWLYFLAATQRNTVLGRVNVARWSQEGLVPVSGGAGAMALSPDGKQLAITQLGRVVVIDPNTLLAVRNVLGVGAATTMVAGSAGRVFLAEHGRGGVITVADTQRGVVLGRWALSLPGRVFLSISPDQRRLFLSCSGVADNRVCSLRVDGDWAVRPALLGLAWATKDAPVRGETFVSPDGRYLINRLGTVFRLAPGPGGELPAS
jgi:hypothetical protein